jgi:hypothetical protein
MASPDVPGAQAALSVVSKTPERPALHSPAEVVTVKEVHAAYKQLAPNVNEAITYLQTIVETRTRERESAAAVELSPKEIERSVAVELAAREYLIQAYDPTVDRGRAIQLLEECEILLQEHSGSLPAGFLARDWFDLCGIAHSMHLPWAAARFCSQGLSVDPEHNRLQEFSEKLRSDTADEIRDQIVSVCRHLTRSLDDSSISSRDKATQTRQGFATSDSMRKLAPSFSAAVDSLLSAIIANRNDVRLSPDLADRANMYARMEMPQEAFKELELLFTWAAKIIAGDEIRVPVDIDPYDGQIWPRSDEREGCCLIAVTGRSDVHDFALYDKGSQNIIWHGNLTGGRTEYIRWVVERDDGLVADDMLDLSLTLEARTAPDNKISTTTSVSVSVASSEPRWPTYPTGALSPDDVPGNELYGRSSLIRKITTSLGKRRAQASYLIEAPRQMGKTSLLNFVKQQVPVHVLAVYVNLELPWSKKAPRNPWDYLVERVRSESGCKTDSANTDQESQDLVRIVSEICRETGKAYVLLLLDDLHSLLERADDPRSVLAVFRDFHNDSSNHISLLLADRYTRTELEERLPNEYWAQLSVLNLGPLDRDGTVRAITTPAEDTDVRFLTETVDRLYYWTGGYPYHAQRAVQYVLDDIWSGPWLTALPSDVDLVIPRIVEDDALFQAGLCRPDRIDSKLEEVIAALLEWRDLVAFLPTLSTDPDWAGVIALWKPQARDLVAALGNPDLLLNQLTAIGVLSRRGSGYEFFSPLVERWLQKMRDHGRTLRPESTTNSWGVASYGDGATLTGDDWQRLDNELVRRCRNARLKIPLKERASSPDDWRNLVREVTGHEEFKFFLSSLFGLFIDGREDKEAMLSYPWLTLAFHRSRLVRNYFEHGASAPSRVAAMAWDQVCTRALGRQCTSYTPATANEWRAVQVLLLRTMFAGMKNAIALIGLRTSTQPAP